MKQACVEELTRHKLIATTLLARHVRP